MNSAESSKSEPTPAQSALQYIEKNPVSAVVQALAVGLAVGLIVRLFEGRSRQEKIDLKRKPTLDDAKYHLGALLLPLLWPTWVKARDGYESSSGSVRDAVEKIRKEVKKEIKSGKLTREGKKRLQEIEKWVEDEAETLVELGRKGVKTAGKWADKESEKIADLAGKAKEDVREWVEDEADCVWKRLRKFFR